MQNFGTINETFKNILLESIISNKVNGKKLFNSYVKSLKENNVLNTQYNIYKKLENKSEDDSNFFVDEHIAVLENIGKDKINLENSKLLKIIKENGYELTDCPKYGTLHRKINNLLTLPRTSKNLKTIVESKTFLHNYTKELVVVEGVSEDVAIYKNKLIGPLMITKFNEKYKDLDESDKAILKVIIQNDPIKKEELYKSTVVECIDLVNTQLAECTIDEKEMLLQVKDKLLRFKYTEESFISEISKIITLKNNLI